MFYTISKSVSPGIGSWTHQYGDAGNTADSHDDLGGARGTDDLRVQWLGRPGADLVTPLVLADGQTAVLVDRGWIPAADAEKYSRNGYIRYHAVTGSAETREFSGTVRLLKPTGLSVISDIDDTVKVSNVTDRRSLLEHTFLLDFVQAPGMAALYDDWSVEDTAFHFVSSSPWQLYEPLQQSIPPPEPRSSTVSPGLRLAMAVGLPVSTMKKGIESLKGVPGRLEAVANRAALSIFIDYAHTPDALENVLTALRRLTSGRVITVFGCGGDRDRDKRPMMGAAAGRLSDLSVLTSDNPRSEAPAAILSEIIAGTASVRDHRYEPRQLAKGFDTAGYVVEPDRRRAIALGLGVARRGDTVLVAGK